MKLKIFLTLLLIGSFSFGTIAQTVLKENLSKKVNFYYDKNRIQLQASGYYYKDASGETTEKHGRWRYYDRTGALEEERHYYKDMLYGKTLVYFPNKQLRREGYFKFNKQDSIFKEYYENGKLMTEGEYQLDRPVGTWKYYYLTGKLKSVEQVADSTVFVEEFYLPDRLHTQTIVEGNGELTVFFQTGKIKEHYNYKNGLKEGDFEEYSIYDYPLLKGSFKEGKRHGKWTHYFYTGEVEKELNYTNGILDGPFVNYYDNKKVQVKGQYDMGKKIGTWEWFTNAGTVDMKGDFLEDEQHGDWFYHYPEGPLSYEAHFDKGMRTGKWKYFYKNQKPFKIGTYENDKKNGLWETWYENEVLLMSGNYKDGKEEGVWENYWQNGELKNKSTFKAGLLNGEWQSFHESGKLSIKGFYTDNFKDGEWISYFENGMPKEIKNYKLFKEKEKLKSSPIQLEGKIDSR